MKFLKLPLDICDSELFHHVIGGHPPRLRSRRDAIGHLDRLAMGGPTPPPAGSNANLSCMYCQCRLLASCSSIQRKLPQKVVALLQLFSQVTLHQLDGVILSHVIFTTVLTGSFSLSTNPSHLYSPTFFRLGPVLRPFRTSSMTKWLHQDGKNHL